MEMLSKSATIALKEQVTNLCHREHLGGARDLLGAFEDQVSDEDRHEMNDMINAAELAEDQQVIWSAIRTLRDKYTGDLPQGVSSLEEALPRLG
jgi:hypothetical protein